MKKVLYLFGSSVCFLIGGISHNALAQDQPEARAAQFAILIETAPEGLKLTCESGCAFKELTFALKEGEKQKIDQYGMWRESGTRDPEGPIANFAIEITRTEKGLSFDGLEGTNWRTLTSSCDPGRSCLQRVDQNGVRVGGS